MKPVQFLDLVASGCVDEYLVSRDESPVTCVLYLLVVIAHHDRIGAVNEKNTFINYWSMHDFYYIWWLLKEPFSFSFFFGDSFSRGSSFTLDDECFFFLLSHCLFRLSSRAGDATKF